MIKVETNIGEVSENILVKLHRLTAKDFVRPVIFDLIDLMTRRIHIEGKAADNSQIGTYSQDYMKLRQRVHNRDNNTMVVVSLTRQLENDWSEIATDQGYGIGFKNVHNLDKARWVEGMKHKKIFFLSQSELDYSIERINELTKEALK